MKATGTIQVPARRYGAPVPLLVLASALLLGIGAVYLVRGITSEEAPIERQPTVGAFAPASQDWGFVLNADTAHVLAHRPGLTPEDLVRTHAFGWEGPTIREVLRDPALVKERRLQPSLTPIDLVRLEARGSGGG